MKTHGDSRGLGSDEGWSSGVIVMVMYRSFKTQQERRSDSAFEGFGISTAFPHDWGSLALTLKYILALHKSLKKRKKLWL